MLQLLQWPGAAVMVIREGKVRLRSFYGLSDIERETPITGRTAFRLASLTKPFTAMAIMILVEKGRLRSHADRRGRVLARALGVVPSAM